MAQNIEDHTVKNAERNDVSGTAHPGCKECGNVYSHKDDCPLLLTRPMGAQVASNVKD